MSAAHERLTPLSKLIQGYPKEEPQYGDELYDHGLEGLSGIASELLQHVDMAVRASELPTVRSPDEALELLASKHDYRRKLFARKRVWRTFVLDERCRLVRRLQRSGWVATHCYTSWRVPTAEQLCEYMPLPDDGGQYLLLYGGNASILGVCDKKNRMVAEDIAALRSRVAVADVLFYDTDNAAIPTLWSLAVGVGNCGGAAVEFPNPGALRIALSEPGQPTTQEVNK